MTNAEKALAEVNGRITQTRASRDELSVQLDDFTAMRNVLVNVIAAEQKDAAEAAQVVAGAAAAKAAADAAAAAQPVNDAPTAA